MNVAIFGCDPGGQTGLAWGVFDPEAKGGASEALLAKMLSGSATISGAPREQIRAVGELWGSFFRACVHDALLPPDRVWLVCEDFTYRSDVQYGGEDSMISTAIIWGLEGYRMGRADEWAVHKRGAIVRPTMVLQQAGQAKGYATNARLKEWGLWVVGREHERSAWQHVALFLNKFIQQYGAS